MPIPLNPKKIRHACRLHFNGDSFQEIAILMDINPCTLTRWRKTQIWQDYYAQLLEEYEQAEAENAPAPRNSQ